MSLHGPLLPAPVRLSILGGFDLHAGDQPLELSRSAQRVLAFLAVSHSRPVHRVALAERLWCADDARRASASLRSALWRLPRPQGRSLVTSSPTHLRLAPQVGVDLWDSEERARRLAREHRESAHVPEKERENEHAALEALSRDLLPDWCDDWLLLEQESYRQVRLHALEALSTALRAAGRYSAALLAALAAVRGEPLRETAHRRVIEVHLAEGNVAEALRQYESYRRLLAAELGLAPSVGIRGLVAPLLGRPVDVEVQKADR